MIEEKPVIEERTATIEKVTYGTVLVALLEKGPMSNQDLSKYLGWIPQQTSNVLRQLEEWRLISRTKGSFDERKRVVRLTFPLGRSQALLFKWSVRAVRDEIAEKIISIFKPLEEENGKTNKEEEIQ